LYKRESSFHEELADDPGSFTEGQETWFLLFATKDDWKQSANLDGIARGLTWVQENFGTEGITSLAMPALVVLGGSSSGVMWRLPGDRRRGR
jgi:hypothetical protein